MTTGWDDVGCGEGYGRRTRNRDAWELSPRSWSFSIWSAAAVVATANGKRNREIYGNDDAMHDAAYYYLCFGSGVLAALVLSLLPPAFAGSPHHYYDVWK